MASMRFEMDPNIERDLERMILDGVESIADEYQQMLDSLVERYEGRPVSEIKPVLSHAWEAVNGGSITEPELTDFANQISNGTRIVFEVER